MGTILRQAWKELWTEKRFALLFLVNLGLGLSGLLSMEAFRASLTRSLAENAEALLGADLAVSSRRALNPTEQGIVQEIAAGAEARAAIAETFSMVRTTHNSRLVLLKGISENYPLRGALELSSGAKVEGSTGPRLSADEAWMDPDLAKQLKLALGDRFSLGRHEFRLVDFVALDPTQGFRGLALSGRIFLSLSALRATGLLMSESTATYSELFRLKNNADLKARAKRYNRLFTDPAVRVSAAGDAADESGRLLHYLGDFLGLSALVALFLSSLGSAYLFRTWLVRRSRTFALHRVLGLSFYRAAAIPAFQALLLALGSVPLALLLAKIELRALTFLVRSLSPVEIAASLSWQAAIVGFAVASVGTLALSLPFLAALREVAPKDLLGGKLPEPGFRARFALLFLPPAGFLYGLAVYESNSWFTAGIFVGALAAALVVFLIAGVALLSAIRLLAPRLGAAPWPLRHGLLYLSRKGFTSLSAFVALALGSLLLNLLPQLRASLGQDLSSGEGKLPSFFLFDIQEEQREPLVAALAERGLKLENQAPLVRARLLRVNDNSYERTAGDEGFRTREEENEARFRNRGFNLSYRAGLTETETLVVGRPFATSPTEPELSVEERFAGRLGLNLGDRLRFDVQGVEVSGTIVNLRKVRWTSFQPNFFVVFSPGALEGAPKIFLGSLREIGPEKREEVQNLLGEKFPNVSAVDVRATVDRALSLADRMRWALNLMSAISLFAGIVVLFSIAYRQSELRRWDMNLVKVLGASAASLRAQVILEFGVLAFFGSAFGASLSLAFAWICAHYFFDGAFLVDWAPLGLSVVACTGLAILVATLGAGGVWRRNPAELLQDPAL